MKLLNLSALTVATNRRLKIGEKTHDIKPLKVIDFIRITETAEQIDADAKAGKITAIQELKLVIDLIKSTAPTVEEAELEALSIQEIHQIANFIKGIDVDGVVEELAEETADAEGK